MPFLGSPLAFTLVYIWSRRNPSIPLNFLGLFVFTAPYLPWVLLGFTLLLNSHFPTGDLMGIAVGHIYYFFEDVWPKELASGGRRYLQTPSFLYVYFFSFGVCCPDCISDFVFCFIEVFFFLYFTHIGRANVE